MGTFILCDIPCHSLKSFIFGPRSFKLKMHSNSHILIIVSEKIILNHMLVTACQLITVSSSCWILSLPFHLQPQAAGEVDLITDPIGHPERSQRIARRFATFCLNCKTMQNSQFKRISFSYVQLLLVSKLFHSCKVPLFQLKTWTGFFCFLHSMKATLFCFLPQENVFLDGQS